MMWCKRQTTLPPQTSKKFETLKKLIDFYSPDVMNDFTYDDEDTIILDQVLQKFHCSLWIWSDFSLQDQWRTSVGGLMLAFTMCLSPNLQLPEPDQRLIQLFWWEFICSVAFVPNVLQCNPLHLSTLICCQIETYRDRGFTWSSYLQNIVSHTWFLIISGHPWAYHQAYHAQTCTYSTLLHISQNSP